MIAKGVGWNIGLMVVGTALCPGCEPAGPRRSVSGTVTFQGRPLQRGTIQFISDQGPAGGALIRNGAYRLPAEQGLMPGRYRVWISATEPLPELKEPGASAPPTRELIPPEFNARSTQTVEVTDKGPNRFPFDIPSPAPDRSPSPGA